MNFYDENIPAYFSKLKKEDISNEFINCSKLKHSEYGNKIINNFKKKLAGKSILGDYYTIETTSKEIKGLANIIEEKNSIYINFIQAIRTNWEEIKGIGTNLLYGICKLAKEKRLLHIELDAAHAELFDFYKQLGFQQSTKNNFHFYLTHENYDKFIKKIEHRYR